VKANIIADLAGGQTTWQVCNTICERVPLTVEFFCAGIWGRFDWMPLFDERVEIDHL
jgi:hypothetical protein